MEVFLLFAFAALSIIAQVQFSLLYSVLATFLFLRTLEFLQFFMTQRRGTGGSGCDKVKNALAFILYLAIAVIAHLLMFGFVLRSSQL